MVVLVMLSAVAVAASFFAGILIGRSGPEPKVASSGSNNGNRLYRPLATSSRGKADSSNPRNGVTPAANIQGPVRAEQPQSRKYVIRVAAYPHSQVGKDFASKNAAILKERGFPAECRLRGRYITIEVGTFAKKDDPAAIQMLSKLKAFQLGGGRPFKDAFVTSVSN
ncbi:MAG: hypothetical protein ACYS8W_16035 [Planctomycetota bacterium]